MQEPDYFEGKGAAEQAAKDLDAYFAKMSAVAGPGVVPIPAIISGVAIATQAGTSVLGAIQSLSDAEKEAALEVVIENLSSKSVVPYDINTTHADTAQTSTPIGPGQSDDFLFTRDDPFDNDTEVEIRFLVDGAEVKLVFNSNEDQWRFKAKVDDNDSHQFDDKIKLQGLSFSGSSDSDTSVYFMPTESRSSSISVLFIDTAS